MNRPEFAPQVSSVEFDRKSRVARAVSAVSLMLVSSSVFAGSTYSYSFNDGVLPSTLSAFATPGFAIDLSSGAAVMSKQQGTGNGSVSLTTNFQVAGNFDVVVEINRGSLDRAANAGLTIYNAQGFADIFAQGPGGESGLNSVIANILLPTGLSQAEAYPGYGSGIQFANTDGLDRFEVMRSGDTLTLSKSQYGVFKPFQSATSSRVEGPLTISLFMDQEFNNTSYHLVTFDNLSITADEFISGIPEPSTWAMLAVGGVMLLARKTRRQ